MEPHYHIVYNPLTYDLMDLSEREGLTPYHIVSFLCGRDAARLSKENFLSYLAFDPQKRRQGMVETFAVESHAAQYVAHQVARLDPQSTVCLADDKRRTLAEVIARKGRPPRAVFVTAMSANFPTAVAASLVLNAGGVPVVLGGIHVSTSPQDVDTYIRRHAVMPERIAQVRGPADSEVIERVLDDLASGALQPEYEGRTPVEDGVWRPRSNVEVLPPLRMEHLKRFPLLGPLVAKRFRLVPVAPYLGCPHACRFCSISSLPARQRAFTSRSTGDVLEELEHHLNASSGGVRPFFFFLPDNLLFGGRRLESLLDGILERGLRLHFAAQISIDVASRPRLLGKLRLAGATHAFIGFESLNEGDLAFVEKPVTGPLKRSGLPAADYYAGEIHRVQRQGVSIHGAFMFGLPGDRFQGLHEHTGAEVARFCRARHIGLQPSALSDLPGSELFRESQAAGTSLYGRQGTMDYLLGLCLTDLTETNRTPPKELKESPLVVGYMTYEAARLAGAVGPALVNALWMMVRAFQAPTHRGRQSFKARLEDALYGFASQLIVSLYKVHGDLVARSGPGRRGAFERLWDQEADPGLRRMFARYVRRFLFHGRKRGPRGPVRA